MNKKQRNDLNRGMGLGLNNPDIVPNSESSTCPIMPIFVS
jgi:hypothetical protein